MNRLEKTLLWKVLEKALRTGLVISGSLVTLITFAAVITRELNINFLGYEEILIICAFWLYMLGAAHGSFEKSHIAADVIIVMMPDNMTRAIITILRNTVTLVLGIIFLYWAYDLFSWTIEMQTKTPVWRIPVTVAQSSLLFGLSLVTFYNVVYLYDEIKLFVKKFITKEITVESSSDDLKEV